jgi:hypothetical protein
MAMRPQLLLELIEGSISDSGANDLLREYQRGLDIETLRPCLQSSRIETTKTATWILAELADRGSALWDELPRLLSFDDRRVRFWACEAVHFAARRDASILALLAARIADDDDAVAWKALALLVATSDDDLERDH